MRKRMRKSSVWRVFMRESQIEILQNDYDSIANQIESVEELYKKTILVTGATGLIGSSLVKALLCLSRVKNLNLRIVALVRNYEKALGVFREVKDREELEFIECDLLEGEIKINFFVDSIIHTACITDSITMVKYPVKTIMTSLNGTKAVLEFAKSRKVTSVIYLSSMEVYGVFNDFVYASEEDLGKIDLTSVRSSYPESKRMCECLCMAYASEFQTDVIVARLAQTFGAGILESDHRIYAQIVRNVIEGKDIVLHTEGNSEGNYIYISDAIRAIITLLLRGARGETYNVANERCHMKIHKMAEMVANRVAKGKIKVVYDIPETNFQFGYAPDTRMKLNTTKIQALGWFPQIDLEEAYKRTIAYMVCKKQRKCEV